MTRFVALALSLVTGVITITTTLSAEPIAPFETGRASFSVRVKKLDIPYDVFALYVLPRSSLHVEIATGHGAHSFTASATEGRLDPAGKDAWDWIAPADPGLHAIIIRRADAEDAIRLNVFVMVPFSRIQNGMLNGYRIGDYPKTLLKNLSIYRPPTGFVEVTKDNEDTLISPHFTLGQFLCKQEGDYPKYVTLREPLLLKLELLLQHVNVEHGIRCDGFVIMSGYRTPLYNAAIGNVVYSRHVWGGAADIYIDENPRDGVMDDLDGNGRIDVEDAAVLYGIVDELYGKPFYTPFVGGLGRYRRTSAHGPFVHVDVRGFRARWGD